MPTPEEYIHDAGADLTPTLGAHGAQIEQAIELATPNSYRGLVIYSESTPATTGQPTGYATNWYQWHRRCLWLKPSTGEIFRFNGTTWELAKGSVAAAAITNAMIANGTIQIGKLSPTGGSALQIIRVNAGGTALEYATLASALVNNSVALSKLVSSGVGKYFLVSNNGTNVWELFDSAAIIALFGANEFPVNSLAHGSGLQVLAMNSDGTAVVWSSVITLIPNGSLALAKLTPLPADVGKILRVGASGAIEVYTPGGLTNPAFTRTQPAVAAIPADNSFVDIAHTQAGKPQIVNVRLVAQAGVGGGYATGDEISLDAVYTSGSGAEDGRAFLVTEVDGTNVRLIRNNASSPAVIAKNGASTIALNTAHWRILVDTLYFA